MNVFVSSLFSMGLLEIAGDAFGWKYNRYSGIALIITGGVVNEPFRSWVFYP